MSHSPDSVAEAPVKGPSTPRGSYTASTQGDEARLTHSPGAPQGVSERSPAVLEVRFQASTQRCILNEGGGECSVRCS